MRDAPLSMQFTEGAAACPFQLRVHKRVFANSDLENAKTPPENSGGVLVLVFSVEFDVPRSRGLLSSKQRRTMTKKTKTCVLTAAEKATLRKMGGRVAGDPPVIIETPHPTLDRVAEVLGMTAGERREVEATVAQSRHARPNRKRVRP
jgi:hypothetical protein